MLTLKELTTLLREKISPISHSREQVQTEISYIFEYVLNRSISACHIYPDQSVSAESMAKIEQLLEKRLGERVPVQYLTQAAFFYGLKLRVTPDVLIPRPETELLVEKALVFSRERGYQRFLDMGTGSGAIALALAVSTQTSPEAKTIVATDVCPKALDVARQNAECLGVDCHITFREGDTFAPFEGDPEPALFDVILFNPPYLNPADLPGLAPEVRDHEPYGALVSPLGHRYYYEHLAHEAPRYLAPGGVVLMELGEDTADFARETFKSHGFEPVTIERDFSGFDRVLTAFRPGYP